MGWEAVVMAKQLCPEGGGAYMSCLPLRPQEILPFLCRK